MLLGFMKPLVQILVMQICGQNRQFSPFYAKINYLSKAVTTSLPRCSGYHPQTSVSEVNHRPIRIMLGALETKLVE